MHPFRNLRDWWLTKKEEEKPTPEPAPVPAPAPETPAIPELPEVEPSRVQVVNYVRVLAILRSIPYKKLKEEFFKLPLRQLAWLIGVGIWLYMTYAIGLVIFSLLR